MPLKYAKYSLQKALLLAALLIPGYVFVQNLVINPSFENYSQCPSIMYTTTSALDEMTLPTGWQSARYSPHYYNSCDSYPNHRGVPNNGFGHQAAATGNGYAGMMAYLRNVTDRCLISGSLSSPLVVGASYTVSYKVSLAGESSAIAVNKLGVDFSVNNPGCYWGGTQPSPACQYPLTNTPDLWTDDIINDSVGWTTLTWNFIATEPSNYIVIGIFHDVPQEQLIYNPPSGNYPVYYYFDDVSVVENIPCTVSVSHTDVTCYGSNDGTATATVTSGNAPYTYTWSPAPGSGQNTPNAAGLSAQAYTLTVSTSEGSCTASTVVAQPDSIALDLSTENPFCGQNNGEASVTATNGVGAYTYSWDNAPGTSSISGLSAGIHTLTVTDANGCTADRTFELENEGLPVTVTSQNPSITEGDSVQLNATGGITYSWSPAEDLSCTTCANPYASPAQTTVYTVTASNADGCSGSASITVKVVFDCPEVFVPTIFSPNGDGQNDEIGVMSGCITDMVFIIYDRWGEKVYQATDPNDSWDGNIGGSMAQSGAYVYKLNAVLKDGQHINQGGSITLIR